MLVIDGRRRAVGSRRGEFNGTEYLVLARFRSDDHDGSAVACPAWEDGGISISLPNNTEARADVWLSPFMAAKKHTSKSFRGENHGKTLTSK